MKLIHRTVFATIVLYVLAASPGVNAQLATPEVSAQPLSPETAIDRYVKKPDNSYAWKIVHSNSDNGVKSIVVDMVSQTWLTRQQVDRPQWQHWVTFAIPDNIRSNIGLLYIGGGKNGGDRPNGPSDMIKRIAMATGTVVAELRMVPNQPLVFHDDGHERVEDDLIGYAWDQYLKTGDAIWLPRNAMVKSAVRAMDTMTAVVAEVAEDHQVDKFVVAGGSKRGWTTWLTGALDKRVVAIIPIVIDVLNVGDSMQHHFAAYGFWAPAIGNYVEHRIMERMRHPRLQEAYQLVDPYHYRHRLTMPKFILNAAGDQFFLPDSSQFYWSDLQGEKYLRYVPNADHGMDGSDAIESLIAFYSLIVRGKEPPRFSWVAKPDGSLQVKVEDSPREVRLWQASNPSARDFRVETLGRQYTSQTLTAQADGLYIGNVQTPTKGWTAYFVELTYDVGAPAPLKLSTHVRVVPDVLPYKGKDATKPATLTIACEAPDEETARQVIGEAGALFKNELSVDKLLTEKRGTTCYFNWLPSHFDSEASQVTKWLTSHKCGKIRYQLESGVGITTAD